MDTKFRRSLNRLCRLLPIEFEACRTLEVVVELRKFVSRA